VRLEFRTPGTKMKAQQVGSMIKCPRAGPANGCAPSPPPPPPPAGMLPGSFHPLRLGTAWQLPYLYTVVQQNMLPSAHPYTGNGVTRAERRRSFPETADRGMLMRCWATSRSFVKGAWEAKRVNKFDGFFFLKFAEI
jgi:hypothetical protein